MKILIIGLGGIGQRHVRNLRALFGDSIEILAYRVRGRIHVVTPAMSADASRNVEDEYSIRVFSSLDAALSEGPNAAFVCNPSNMHVPAALAAVRSGCDVFIEKPVSHSMNGTPELLHEAAARNAIVMVGYQLRFHPCIIKLAEILESGVLGNLLAGRATIGEYLPNWHPFEDYRQMYASRADLGGGVVLSQIHELDYLYSYFGLPGRVYAVGGHWSELEIDVEDTASILMEFELAGRPLPIQLHQDYLQSPPNRQCEVIGDRGRAIMDLHELSVSVFTRGDPSPVHYRFAGFERNQLFVNQLKHFMECLNTRKRPIVDLQDGLQSLRMALAVKQSMITHQPVELATIG
jgi:predicted dehydrogenase